MGTIGMIKGATTLIGGRQQRKFGEKEAKLGEEKYEKQLKDFRSGKFDAQVSGEMAKTRTDATRLAAQASRRASDRAGAQQQQLLGGAGRGDVRGLAAAAGQARQLEMGAQQAQQQGAQTILGAQQEFGKYAAGVQAKNESQRSQLEAMELARGAARFDAGRLTKQEGTQTTIEGTGQLAAGATTTPLSGMFGSKKGQGAYGGKVKEEYEKGGKVESLEHPEAFWGALIKVGAKMLGKVAGKALAKGGAKALAKGGGKALAKGGGKAMTKMVPKQAGKLASSTAKPTLQTAGKSSSTRFLKGDPIKPMTSKPPAQIENVKDKPEIKSPLKEDKPKGEGKPEGKQGEEGEKKEGEKREGEKWERQIMPKDISGLAAHLSAPSGNFARAIGQKKDSMEKGGYVGENGGITEGEFSHKKNPINMTNEDGKKIGEVTGGEYVFNEKQSSVMEELVRKNEPEMLIKFMRKLLSQPQFN